MIGLRLHASTWSRSLLFARRGRRRGKIRECLRQGREWWFWCVHPLNMALWGFSFLFASDRVILLQREQRDTNREPLFSRFLLLSALSVASSFYFSFFPCCVNNFDKFSLSYITLLYSTSISSYFYQNADNIYRLLLKTRWEFELGCGW